MDLAAATLEYWAVLAAAAVAPALKATESKCISGILISGMCTSGMCILEEGAGSRPSSSAASIWIPVSSGAGSSVRGVVSSAMVC